MSTAVIGSLFTGGIAGGILSAFVSRYPNTLGSLTHEQAAAKLQAGFHKMQVMNITVQDLPQEQLSALKEVVVHGVDNAMQPIFLIIMVISLLAAIIAAFFLKKKKS